MEPVETWPTLDQLREELKTLRQPARYAGAQDAAFLLRALAEHHAETRMIAAELKRLAGWLEAA